MKDRLNHLRNEAVIELENVTNIEQLETARVRYMGKKGELTGLLKEMGRLDAQERPIIGKIANEIREELEEIVENKKNELKTAKINEQLRTEMIDVTIPVKPRFVGKIHPITQVTREMEQIFMSMGFSVVEGPEIETVNNNFDALNAPLNHPSRDMTDTFYIDDQLLLRTQTSPVQVRTMRENKPPIKVISPGRCFRSDAPDATHSPMFHQLEGLVIDKHITFANLKSTLEQFALKFFGPDTRTKFRPHNFPFTEPSAEMDISCFKCGGSGCSTCKQEGWMEILGAGMVHPNVLANCGIDPEIYSGFAFGMGIDRLAMAKYEVDDIRYFYENDMRFLKQF